LLICSSTAPTVASRALPPQPSQPPSPEELQKMIEQQRVQLARINFGFEKLERLPGNIGYLDRRAFTPAALTGETAAAAMNFLSNSEAVIIDLRKNGGGDPATDRHSDRQLLIRTAAGSPHRSVQPTARRDPAILDVAICSGTKAHGKGRQRPDEQQHVFGGVKKFTSENPKASDDCRRDDGRRRTSGRWPANQRSLYHWRALRPSDRSDHEDRLGRHRSRTRREGPCRTSALHGALGGPGKNAPNAFRRARA
jgi:hypothetical protein